MTTRRTQRGASAASTPRRHRTQWAVASAPPGGRHAPTRVRSLDFAEVDAMLAARADGVILGCADVGMPPQTGVAAALSCDATPIPCAAALDAVPA